MPIRITERRSFNPADSTAVPAPTVAAAIGGAALSPAVSVSANAGVAAATGSAPDAAATLVDRSGLIIGVDQPNATNTGCPPGLTLTVVTAASQLVATDGTVGLVQGKTYERYDVRFRVDLPTGTQRIIFRYCIFRGTAAGATSTNGLIRCFVLNHTPLAVYDCTFRPQTPSPYWVGLHGYDYWAYRCDFSYLVDPFEIFNSNDGHREDNVNVIIRQNYCHDLSWWPGGTPGTSIDGSHNDCVQYEGGYGAIIEGNFFDATNAPEYPNTNYGGAFCGNTVILVKPDVGFIGGLVFRYNWCKGGNFATVIMSHDEEDPTTPRWLPRLDGGGNAPAGWTVGVFENNVFYRDTSRTLLEILAPGGGSNHPLNISWGSVGAGTANVMADNGQVVTVSNGAD